MSPSNLPPGFIQGEFLNLELCKKELNEYIVDNSEMPVYWYSPSPLNLPHDMEHNKGKVVPNLIPWLIIYCPVFDYGVSGGWLRGDVPKKYLRRNGKNARNNPDRNVREP